MATMRVVSKDRLYRDTVYTHQCTESTPFGTRLAGFLQFYLQPAWKVVATSLPWANVSAARSTQTPDVPRLHQRPPSDAALYK